MYSALYFPHTTIRSEAVVKTALLLWDKLEYIAPWPGFKPEYPPAIARAADVVIKPHLVSVEEQQEAHGLIEQFAAGQLPAPFYYQPRFDQEYEIYPQKLLPDTWELLRGRQLAGSVLPNSDYPLTQPAGLCVMSLLADCCAGSTRIRITDRNDGYASLSGLLTAPATAPGQKSALDGQELVPIALDVIDAGSISLERLIAFREREDASGGHAIRAMRHRYLDRLESYVTTLAKAPKKSDQRTIKEQFLTDMKDDLAFLRDELKFTRNESLASKEVIVSVMAGAGALASFALGVPQLFADLVTAVGAPVTVGGLLSVRNKYFAARRAVLQKHPMAYLYELGG
jgi:hypothetical protein